MKCEIIRNNHKLAGPMMYDPQMIRDLVSRQGANPALVPNHLTGLVKIATILIKPVREVRPTIQPGQRHINPVRVERDHEIVYEYQVGQRTVTEMRNTKKHQLDTIHGEYEEKRFLHNNVMIKADVKARVNARATLDLFDDGVITQTKWWGKAPSDIGETEPGSDGASDQNAFIAINSRADMKSVYDAIVARLSKGFQALESVGGVIDSASEADLPTLNVRSQFDQIVNA